LKIVKSPHINDKLSDFDGIWYTAADMELVGSHVTNTNFKKLRWRTAAILKIVFGHNSAADCLISVKFCVWKQFFFTKIRDRDSYPRFTERISCFLNAVWASVSSDFSYVSDNLVILLAADW